MARWVGLSTVIGVLGGLAAVLFDLLTHQFRDWFVTRPTGLTTEGLGTLDSGALWILLIPTVGGIVFDLGFVERGEIV